MEIIADYLEKNYVMLTMLGGMTVVMKRNAKIGNRGLRCLWSIMFVVFVRSIINCLLRFENQGDFFYNFLTWLHYSLLPLVSFITIRFVSPKGKNNPLSLLLVILNSLFYVTVFFKDIMFSDPITISSYEVLMDHMARIVALILVIIMLIEYGKKQRVYHWTSAMVLILMTISVVIASILQSIGIIDDCLNTVIMVYMVFYYLYLYQEETRRDTVTELLNRSAYTTDSSRYEKVIDAVIGLDMNGLKKINDTEGHEAGDKALRTLAGAFEKSIGKNHRIMAYRTGGDEFIMIYSGSEKSLLKVIENIKKCVAETPYTCSMGYGYRHNNESFTELCQIADKKMYEDKEEFYKRTGLERRK